MTIPNPELSNMLLKQQARKIFMAGVKAANPYLAVKKSLRINGNEEGYAT